MNAQQKALDARLRRALALLEQYQGVKSWQPGTDTLDSLMRTVLSQSTNDRLRDEAYRRLRRRFPSWQEVLQAPTAQVQEAIRVAGLSQQKAPRMQEILAWVKERFGELSLAELEGMADDAVIELLTTRKGIGVKTAAVVLMFALGRDLCPVDTHVHRIARRLAWVEEKASAERTFWILKPHVPPGEGYSLHMNLLQFGRTICLARQPLCGVCFLYDECHWAGKEDRRREMQKEGN